MLVEALRFWVAFDTAVVDGAQMGIGVIFLVIRLI